MGNAPAKLLFSALFSLPHIHSRRDRCISIHVHCLLVSAGFVSGKLARQLAQLLSGGHRLAANWRLRLDSSRPGQTEWLRSGSVCPFVYMRIFQSAGQTVFRLYPVGFGYGQTFRSVVSAGFGCLGRAGWVLCAALCFS